MSRLEELELRYHVIPVEVPTFYEGHGTRINLRFKVVLRWQGDPTSDRLVAENLTEGAAQDLRDKLALGGLDNTDIRRIHDCGARQFRDDPGRRDIIY